MIETRHSSTKKGNTKSRRQKKKKLQHSLLIVSGLLLACLWFYPFFLIVINSFKTKGEIFQSTLSLPGGLSFENYQEALEKLDFIRSLMNSLLITVGSLILVVFVSSMAAYALSRNTSRLS